MRKLKVETHDRQSFMVEVEEYEPNKLAEEIDNTDKLTIVIGELIISRINIKTVFPVDRTLEGDL